MKSESETAKMSLNGYTLVGSPQSLDFYVAAQRAILDMSRLKPDDFSQKVGAVFNALAHWAPDVKTFTNDSCRNKVENGAPLVRETKAGLEVVNPGVEAGTMLKEYVAVLSDYIDGVGSIKIPVGDKAVNAELKKRCAVLQNMAAQFIAKRKPITVEGYEVGQSRNRGMVI